MALSVAMIFSACIVFTVSHGNECVAPPQFPTKFQDAQLLIAMFGFTDLVAIGFETPITTRQSLAVGMLQWNCLATYDSKALALLTEERPILADNIPSDLYSDTNKLMCYTYSLTQLFQYLLFGEYSTNYAALLQDEWGLESLDEIILLQTDVEQCEDDEECLDNIASRYNYCANVMGTINGVQIVNYLKTDGFNQDGSKTPFGECTANCRPFSDPIGFYDPRIDLKDISIDRKTVPGLTSANKHKWLNLLEDNGKGFFYRQEHVVPHIGYVVDPIIMPREQFNALSAAKPNYDYESESELVMDRLSETANNITQKAIIETLDDKVALLSLVVVSHWSFFEPSYEQNIIFETGNRLSEYFAILLSWKEKIKYNLVRPTTVIQSGEYTDDEITTYAGPFQGVKTIKPQDFQPYIRVMPHAEYPSASGCVCKIVQQHTDEFMWNTYGIRSLPVFFQFRGFTGFPSDYEPGLGQEDVSFRFENMQQLYHTCADSRLWGGMHFTAAITEADKLCSGIGNNIYHYLQSLLNGEVTDIDVVGDFGSENPDLDSDDRRRLNGAQQQRTNIEAEKYFAQYVEEMNKGKKLLDTYSAQNDNIENNPK